MSCYDTDLVEYEGGFVIYERGLNSRKHHFYIGPHGRSICSLCVNKWNVFLCEKERLIAVKNGKLAIGCMSLGCPKLATVATSYPSQNCSGESCMFHCPMHARMVVKLESADVSGFEMPVNYNDQTSDTPDNKT